MNFRQTNHAQRTTKKPAAFATGFFYSFYFHNGLLHDGEADDLYQPYQESGEAAAEEGRGIGSSQCIYAVDNGYACQDYRRISVTDFIGDMFLGEDRRQGPGTEHVGDDVGDDGQVGQEFELGSQGRADGHEGQEALHAEDAQHAFDRYVSTGDFGKNLGEQAALGAGLEDAGQGELPGQEGTGTGEYHEAHDGFASRIAEHVREGQAEGSARCQDFRIGDDAGDDIRRGDVDDGDAEGADEGGNRNGFLRVFNGIHVDRCRFESQEGPQRQGDGIADGIAESQIIGVPRSQPRSRAEPMPADDGNAQDRDDGTPDGNGAELAGITGAAEIEGCRDPQ